MDATAISSLVNLGSAGAVIIVVIIMLKVQEKRDAYFLSEMEKRDKANRDFFTELNRANCEDGEKRLELTEKILEMVGAVLAELKAHDDKVDDRINRAVTTITKRSGTAK